jgi:malic enzyme
MTSEAINFHKNLKGKTKVVSKVKLSKDNLHLAYTPGVGEISNAIATDKSL